MHLQNQFVGVAKASGEYYPLQKTHGRYDCVQEPWDSKIPPLRSQDVEVALRSHYSSTVVAMGLQKMLRRRLYCSAKTDQNTKVAQLVLPPRKKAAANHRLQ